MNNAANQVWTKRSSILIFRAAILAITTFVSACAGQVPVHSIASGTTIQVSTPESRIKMPDAQGAGEAVGKGVAKGAGMGVVGGLGAGLYGSILCGPLFIICAPVLAGGGAAVGLIAGGAIGTIAGARIALPNKKASALDTIIAATLEDNSLSQALRTEFDDQNAGYWSITDAEENVQVTIELDSFFIEQFKDDNVQLRMTSTMIVRNGPDKHATTKEIPFAYDGHRHHVDYWLENDGENFRAEVSDAFASNVRKMIRVLKSGTAPSS